MIIDFLKKIVKSFKAMITQDNIAAAQLAQIFGSELLRVQQSVSDSTSHPDIVKMNPKQFLVGQHQHEHHRKIEEQQFIAKINREAEMMHPLPRDVPPPINTSLQPVITPVQPIGQPSGTSPLHADVLVLIANFLERIALKLESVDLKPKRKTIKRKQKSKKPVLLNENHV